jgi:hypothetical protein
MGILTKSDLICNALEQSQWISIAQNRAFKYKYGTNNQLIFGLGWQVLRNRDSRVSWEPGASSREASYFENSLWGQRLHPEQLGAVALRSKISKLIDAHMLRSINGIQKKLKAKLDDTTARLETLIPSDFFDSVDETGQNDYIWGFFF